jgi:hypothetical protein
MSMPISNGSNVEVVTSVQRRRRWTLEEKIGWVCRAMGPEISVSLAAREAGVTASLNPKPDHKLQTYYIHPSILLLLQVCMFFLCKNTIKNGEYKRAKTQDSHIVDL